MSLKSSDFAIPNPFDLLGRALNPVRHHATRQSTDGELDPAGGAAIDAPRDVTAGRDATLFQLCGEKAGGARKMPPAQLHLDFKGNGWYGEFSI
ncbi:MAG: hypothetical protein OQL08_07710 [Gammaproteobacteria bacterium]|nr:hypothetical protein [Gammaproteobacteria bacterium]